MPLHPPSPKQKKPALASYFVVMSVFIVIALVCQLIIKAVAWLLQ